MLVLFDINQVEDQRVSSGLLYGSPRSVLITEITHLAGPTSEKHGLKNPHGIVILFANFGVILKSVSLETLLCAQMCSVCNLKSCYRLVIVKIGCFSSFVPLRFWMT